ncbi:MAG: flavin reductase family protein [Eubacteriales bacterium]|nr:flavin reductase family protein [Eubacteriales bacterium]MDD4389303.1 flavin reductase family protein [Eubacteriales bacterium]
MKKVSFKGSAMLSPIPPIMVSCGKGGEKNIITIAWTGIINSDPPLTYISVRKSRHSHAIIEREREFIINLPNEAMASKCDYCGVKSGKDVNKWDETGLTPLPADEVGCPMIAEAPVNLECRVIEQKEYPTHDMFIAEIVKVHADASLEQENGKLRIDKAGLIAYCHGEYIPLKSKAVGTFGYSVMKPKTKKRKDAERRAMQRTKK